MTTATRDTTTATPTVCVHHWLLDGDTAREVRGVCRRCGESRLFQNYLPYDQMKPFQRGRAGRPARRRDDESRADDVA